MIDGCTIVVDVGKTNAKATLWDAGGRPMDRCVRANEPRITAAYRALDVEHIEAWLLDCLARYAGSGTVKRIVTVGHGAAAALLYRSELFAAPMDYEDPVSSSDRAAYDADRDAFEHTGSPALPHGLNLGMQLHRLEQLLGPWPREVSIVPWPQYWAWRLCGVMASEVTSLGCHSDLWRPMERRYSAMAIRRGWAERMAPIRRAGEMLATIAPRVAERTGLPGNCEVLCGLHDSNAALLAARGHPEIADNDATVLSTGTWFVAMRSPANSASIDLTKLAESRDCLVNVDTTGRPIPSARFMGGREAELIGGIDSYALTANYNPDLLIARLPALIESGACAFPTFVSGVGPFPQAVGRWQLKPADAGDQRAVTGLYLALMADASLDLIGSCDRLLIEGRFAEAVIFVRALAALRPQQRVFVSNVHHDVAYGALRLIAPDLPPLSPLTPVKPLELDLRDYAARWRARARAAQSAA